MAKLYNFYKTYRACGMIPAHALNWAHLELEMEEWELEFDEV